MKKEEEVLEELDEEVKEEGKEIDVEKIKADAIKEISEKYESQKDSYQQLQERLQALEDEKLDADEKVKVQNQREADRIAEANRIRDEKIKLDETTIKELMFKISLNDIMEKKAHQKEKIKELMGRGVLKTQEDYDNMIEPFDKDLKELYDLKKRDIKIGVGGNVFDGYQNTINSDSEKSEIQKKIDAHKSEYLKKLGKK